MLRINTIRHGEHWLENDETGAHWGCFLGNKVFLQSLVDIWNAEEARENARKGKPQATLPLEVVTTDDAHSQAILQVKLAQETTQGITGESQKEEE